MTLVEHWKKLLEIAKSDPLRHVPLPAKDPWDRWYVSAGVAVDYMRTKLHEKISTKGGNNQPTHWRNVIRYDEVIQDVYHDRRVIKDYLDHRIRHSGSRNLLRHPVYKRAYPHIDNQPWGE